MQTLIQDLRYGVRMLIKNPSFTGVILLTLALGVGVNITIFTVFNSILLRPLPYRDADRLVKLVETEPQKKTDRYYVSRGDINEWRAQSQSFEELVSLMHVGFRVTGAAEPEEISANQVSAKFFEMLGVSATLGRTFLPSDESLNSTPVTVLSHGYWTTNFGADPAVIGKTLNLNERVYTIIGVLPPDFREAFESFPGRAKLWVPLDGNDSLLTRHGPGGSMVLARLKPDVTLSQARAEMTVIAERLAQAYPKSNTGIGANVFPLRDEVTRNTREMLWIFMTAALFVLLIACANVAGLMLTRGIEREREIAIRAAIGAGRWRVMRQLLNENLLLSLVGSAGGILLAAWLLQLIVPLLPSDLPRAEEIRFDARTISLTVFISIFSALFFGLTSAFHAGRVKLTDALKNAGRYASENRLSRYWRNGFVIAQIALTVILLIGAGLLAHSLRQLYQVDPGFSTDNLLTMNLTLPRSNDEVPQQWNLFWDALLERTRGLGEVEHAAAVMPLPLSDSMFNTQVRLSSSTKATPDEDLSVGYFIVSDNFFETLGLRLLSGRFLTIKDQATTETVVVVNETFAHNFFPDQSAIGKTITVDSTQKTAKSAMIVGVVSDSRIRLTEPIQPQIYKSLQQFPSPSIYVITRTHSDPKLFGVTLRGLVHNLNKNQPVEAMRTMDELWSRYTVTPRFYLTLLGGFALLALLLAMTGIYGVLSYTVSQRTQEIGIRLALGAPHSAVLKMILWQGMTLALSGIFFGIGAAFYLARLMKGLLFNVSASDPFTFIFTPLIFTLTAFLACYIPARRAIKVDPMIALRCE